MPTAEQVRQWRGEELVDSHGDKIGKIEEIYLDTDTGEPEWVLVNTGLLGKSTFVPIKDASREGEALRVPYEKSQVKDAPTPDPDGQLSQQEEADLYRHYGLEYGDADTGSGRAPSGGGQPPAGGDAPSDAGQTGRGASGRGETGRGETGRGGDDAMTRSEEELRVGTTQRESGRVRLRKYVETEDVDERVTVGREEARVEREPITDDNIDQAMSGPEISEDDHEVVLHEEEVVADKRTVPKERVRLEKDSTTEEEQVSETVRKERVEVEEGDRQEH